MKKLIWKFNIKVIYIYIYMFFNKAFIFIKS